MPIIFDYAEVNEGAGQRSLLPMKKFASVSQTGFAPLGMSKLPFYFSQILFVLLLVMFLVYLFYPKSPKPAWTVRSVDTMKYSRDMARAKLNDPGFDADIDRQLAAIAKTGATHVAIDTPYDEEFLPYLRRWVKAARRHQLQVWFRGNWSGWEQWFGYNKIDSGTHYDKTKAFIFANKDLFEDGDIFTACPECENGLQIHMDDQEEMRRYKHMLLEEYGMTKQAFAAIGKDVASNYTSMNSHMAEAVMDAETTRQLDGIVAVDYYPREPEELARKVRKLAAQSGGRIVLAEFGAPIPDTTGPLTEKEQADWLQRGLTQLAGIPELTGVNYWVNAGGTTGIWQEDGTPKPGAGVLRQFYKG